LRCSRIAREVVRASSAATTAARDLHRIQSNHVEVVGGAHALFSSLLYAYARPRCQAHLSELSWTTSRIWSSFACRPCTTAGASSTPFRRLGRLLGLSACAFGTTESSKRPLEPSNDFVTSLTCDASDISQTCIRHNFIANNWIGSSVLLLTACSETTVS